MDDNKLFELAMGRIFRLGSRPTQPGDVEEYERCKGIIMEIAARRKAQEQPKCTHGSFSSFTPANDPCPFGCKGTR